MFHVFEEINWRLCRHKPVPLSHIRSTVSDGVSPSPKGGGGGAGSDPSKSATGVAGGLKLEEGAVPPSIKRPLVIHKTHISF